MSNDETNRILGALSAMKDEHGKQLDTIFAKLEDLQTNGCVVGRQHTQDIAELRKKKGDNGNGDTIKFGALTVHGPMAILICAVGYLIAKAHGWIP